MGRALRRGLLQATGRQQSRTPAADVQAGSYPQTTRRWTHVKEFYPSEFPPGDYELTLRADGSFVPDGAAEPQRFHMQTTRRMTITR